MRVLRPALSIPVNTTSLNPRLERLAQPLFELRAIGAANARARAILQNYVELAVGEPPRGLAT